MISFEPLDELRSIRRRLAEECGGDIERYGEMLRQTGERYPGRYVLTPLCPRPVPHSVEAPQSPAATPPTAKA